jgi:hypothetical protein
VGTIIDIHKQRMVACAYDSQVEFDTKTAKRFSSSLSPSVQVTDTRMSRKASGTSQGPANRGLERRREIISATCHLHVDY